MLTIRLETRDGQKHQFTAAEDISLMESIRNAGFDELQAVCGGCASCATCHVYLTDIPAGAELPPLSEVEDELLEASFFRESTSRLACQIKLDSSMDGLIVVLPPPD